MGWTPSEHTPLPEARTEDLLVERVDDELVVYDLASKQVHCLTPVAAVVHDSCDGRTTPAACAARAGLELGQVLEAAAQLHDRNLLQHPKLAIHSGVSRRTLLRRSAAVAVAAPLISSIAAPTAAMAASGIPTGCTGCLRNTGVGGCASGHCCQAVKGKSCNTSCCVAGNNSCQLNEATGVCSVPLAGCGSVVCPPGSTKCCT